MLLLAALALLPPGSAGAAGVGLPVAGPGPAARPPSPVRADTCRTPASGAATRPFGQHPVEGLLHDLRRRHGVPALAAAVVRAEGPPRVAVAGWRRSDRAVPVERDDRFHVGSTTKPLTATLVAVLVRDGALAWTTTLAEAFPGVGEAMSDGYRDVTLRDLLAHRGGLPPFTRGSEFQRLPDLEGSPTERRAAFARWLLRREPASEPGGEFVYSNAGYAVAAAMAESATGESWRRLVCTHLFRPLGIEGGFGWPAAAGASQPWGHEPGEGEVLVPHDPDGAYRVPAVVAPAGDVAVSVGGYAAFLQLHLRGLLGRETELLDPAAVRTLHQPRVAVRSREEADGYALGWFVRHLDDARMSRHAGSAGTFYARVAVRPAQGVAVAVFANAGDEPGREATAEALEALVTLHGEGTPGTSADADPGTPGR